MPYFPNEKISDNKKPPSERDIVLWLRRNDSLFPPVQLDVVEQEHLIATGFSVNEVLQATWKGHTSEYVYEYKTSNTPSTIIAAINQLRAHSPTRNMMPLLIVPYLSPENLAILDDHDISGIDLCGNGVLLSSKNRVWRTGYPNMYKDTRPIRNPFHGDSSIFARCFLLQPQYNSLSDLRSFAMRKAFSDAYELLSPGFALGTASKVVKTLEEELVIKKGEDGIALQDARRLISLLRLGLRPPLQSRVAGKTPITFEEVWNRLAGARLNGTLRSVATGLSSAGRYKVLSGIDRQCLYVDDLTLAGELLEIQPGKAFANIEIIEDHKHLVYFDARAEGNVLWASPIQTWLELSSAGPREQEAAGLLENLLAEGHGADML